MGLIFYKDSRRLANLAKMKILPGKLLERDLILDQEAMPVALTDALQLLNSLGFELAFTSRTQSPEPLLKGATVGLNILVCESPPRLGLWSWVRTPDHALSKCFGSILFGMISLRLMSVTVPGISKFFTYSARDSHQPIYALCSCYTRLKQGYDRVWNLYLTQDKFSFLHISYFSFYHLPWSDFLTGIL